jgi:predicted permease
MQFSEILLNILWIYLGVFAGFIFGRFTRRGERIEKYLSYVVTYINVPLLFIMAITARLSSVTELIPLTIFSLIFPFILLFFSLLFTYKQNIKPETKGAFILTGVFSNAIYLPVPIITIIVGIDAVIVATIFATVQIILRTTLGTGLSLHYSKTIKTKLSKLLMNSILFPPLLATIAGFILFSINFQFTGLIASGIDFIGWLAIPLSIFIIGVSLSTLKFSSVNFKLIFMVSAIQLIIAPIMGYFLLIPFSFSDITVKAMLIEVLMPPAISNILYANVFELDNKLTSAAVIFSTVILLTFLPVIAIII